MKTDALVLPEGDQPALGADHPAEKPQLISKEDLATLRSENARLSKSNVDLSTERYWADKYAERENEPEPEPEDKPDYDENEDSTAFVDDLSNTGVKALEKRGVMTKKSTKAMIEERATEIATKIARDIVGKARTSMTQDAQLVSDFPGLKDEKSELFKETQRIFRENMATDPALAKSPAALIMAAKQAKLEIALKAKAAPAGDDDDADQEQRRHRRIAEQSGSRGRSGAAFDDADDDDAIGPEARSVIAQMSRFGADEASFKKERSKIKAGR